MEAQTTDLQPFLTPNETIDSDAQKVIDFAFQHTNDQQTQTEKAVALFYAVRDGFKYSPFVCYFDDRAKASALLDRDFGHCIAKASLLMAAARVVGIPSRLRLAIVKNHAATDRLSEIFESDLIVCHGHAELLLEGKWLKVTPAFNKELCEKLEVAPLEFDGRSDAILQEYEQEEGGFMEYVYDYGFFADAPGDFVLKELQKHYPHLFEMGLYKNKVLDMTRFIQKK